ncbi:MAG: hypothetical protein Alis3KO_05590 [Aliiglaciecola sp.]
MPKSLSSILEIPSTSLEEAGAFDPILDTDSRLFIDPHLLKHSDLPEFEGSYERLQKRFIEIGKLLANCDEIGDVFWNAADKKMIWPEVQGLCIGYSNKGTSGSGIGPELRKRLLTTAKVIIHKGRNDPELFELVGMFEKDFGSDRISDMTANIIKDDLEAFTHRILEELSINVADKLKISHRTGLPLNPFTGQVIYLVPMSLLRDLPVVLDWSNRDKISIENEAIRKQLNKDIGHSWRAAMYNLTKEKLKEYILKYPELVDDLVSQYTAKEPNHYDFHADRAGEYIWYPAAQKATSKYPLDIQLSNSPSIDEVENVVLKICERFKELIESNGWVKLLYDSDGHPKHEVASQLLFYGIADMYCDLNNVMIARESDAGRGPVDFKFGTRKQNSILVEIKKSTNTSGLKKGITNQLPTYMKSEKSQRAIYLVIDVGKTQAAIDNLKEVSALINGSAIKVIEVDGTLQKSASK